MTPLADEQGSEWDASPSVRCHVIVKAIAKEPGITTGRNNRSMPMYYVHGQLTYGNYEHINGLLEIMLNVI